MSIAPGTKVISSSSGLHLPTRDSRNWGIGDALAEVREELSSSPNSMAKL